MYIIPRKSVKFRRADLKCESLRIYMKTGNTAIYQIFSGKKEGLSQPLEKFLEVESPAQAGSESRSGKLSYTARSALFDGQ